MRYRKITLAVIAIFILMPLYPQELYDLNRCLTTGLERNFSIIIARNREAISENNHTLGNAGFLPSIDISGRYGGTVNDTRQEFSDAEDVVTKGISNTNANAAVALDWTIFQGFTAHTTYKKLSELKTIGELNTQLAVEDFVATMVAEYYYYIQLLRLYHNLAYAVSLSRERVRIDEERYLLGASSKLQLLQSQVYLNSDSSRYAQQNEILQASQVRINELMASENLGEMIRLKDSVIYLGETLNYDSLLTDMQRFNTSLLIARKNKVISEYDYKNIAARTYPYLNFTTGYSLSRNTYDNSQLLNQEVNGLNYGITLGLNVFDGWNQRRDRANARIEMENKEYQYREVEQQVKSDLITLYFGYQNNLLLLKLEEQNLKTAYENLEIALERYKLGNLSGLELREVQQSLLEAEERLLTVQYRTKIAEVSLLQISGGVMDYLSLE